MQCGAQQVAVRGKTNPPEVGEETMCSNFLQCNGEFLPSESLLFLGQKM